MTKPVIYLDHAAATPVDPAILAAAEPYWTDQFYNPSSVYQASREVKQILTQARHKVAQILGVHQAEVLFTAGGSEANNLAIHGIMRRHPEGHMLTSAIEHESVLAPAENYIHDLIPVDEHGIVRVADMTRLIRENTVLASVMYANNEIGTIQPLAEIARAIEQIRRERTKAGNTLPLLLHTDACQAPLYLDLHAPRLGVDLMTLNGSKIYGMKQTGCLYVKGGINLFPLIDGGGQEQGKRSGTENVAGAVAFAKALEMAAEQRKAESKRLGLIQRQAVRELQQAIPNLTINGSQKHRLPSNINFTIPGLDGERAVMELDELGIQCATGSACSALKDSESHVLRAMGRTSEAASASLRLTLGRTTTENDMGAVVAAIAGLVQKHSL